MASEPNPEMLEQKMGIAFGAIGGMLGGAMLYLGSELGLYRGMHGVGEITSSELASKLGLSERFVREWLYQQAAAGVVDHRGDQTFELSVEAAMVFADESFPLTMSRMLPYLPQLARDALDSGEAFRTGIGRDYDALGEDGARQIDAMFSGWNRTSLVGEALPKLDGVIQRLEAGGRVADVGCGAGAAPIAVGAAFPSAQVDGYDNSLHALKVAEESLAEAGLDNVRFLNPDVDPLPDEPSYDLVLTLDCLHDMPRPDLAASAIQRALKPDGAWFIVDIDSAPTPDGNFANPMAPMMFAASIVTCLQSSASTADGLGFGTVGLPEPAMRELAREAGFTRFSRVAGLEHPINAYYEVRH